MNNQKEQAQLEGITAANIRAKKASMTPKAEETHEERHTRRQNFLARCLRQIESKSVDGDAVSLHFGMLTDQDDQFITQELESRGFVVSSNSERPRLKTVTW